MSNVLHKTKYYAQNTLDLIKDYVALNTNEDCLSINFWIIKRFIKTHMKFYEINWEIHNLKKLYLFISLRIN